MINTTRILRPYRRMLRASALYRSRDRRAFNSSPCIGMELAKAKRMPKHIDESSIASAQHRPSIGGASLAHLVSELSATKPGMESLREAGKTMDESQRTHARKVTTWVMGLPVLLGSVIVGVQLWRISGESERMR